MVVRSLVAFAAVLLVACASGAPDSSDYGSGDDGGSGDDAANAVDGSMVRGTDSGSSVAHDSGNAPGADSSSDEDGSTSSGDDGGGAVSDSGTPDTGSVVVDSGAPAVDSGGGGGDICNSSDPIYAIEAATAVTSGKFTLCLTGVCSAGQCCYEELSPGNICVAK
jgi:hypothetical protein